MTARILFLLVLSWPAIAFAGQQETKISIEAKVETLLKKMTLEEKIGQLLQYPELCLREGENFSPKKHATSFINTK